MSEKPWMDVSVIRHETMLLCMTRWHHHLIIIATMMHRWVRSCDHAVRATGFSCSGTISIIFIRFWPPCERIHADNGHSPRGKPIPSYDGSPARPDSSVAGLTSSPWCHPSQEMAELFRRSSYSPRPQGRGVHYGSESRCSNRTRCSGSMRNTSRDQVALAPSSGNQFRTTR